MTADLVTPTPTAEAEANVTSPTGDSSHRQGAEAAPGADTQRGDPTTVLRPRHHTWEIVLCIGTLGLYFSYYLYRLAKDLRTINGTPLTPFWWIFVPFFLLAQLFAYPYLMRELEKAESANDLPQRWSPVGRRAWMLGMWAATLLINVSDVIPNSDIWFVAVFFTGIGFIALLSHRVNQIRAAHWQNVAASRSPAGQRRFTIIEWLIAVTGLPISLSLISIILFSVQMFGGTRMEALQEGQQVQQQGHPFSLTIHGSDWSRVEIGSHSDGTALLELEGANANAYFIVFEHGKDSSLGEISKFRTGESADEVFNTDCEEHRSFIGNTTDVTSILTCRGEFLGNSVLFTSKSIETKNGIYELYGQFIADKATFAHYEDDYRNIEKGFIPQ